TIELNKKELEEVSPELGALFKSDPLVMNAYYYGSLNRLNRDLVVYEQDIHILTFFDKISQSISASLVFRYSSGMWGEITGYAPIWIKYSLQSFGYNLGAYVLSIVIILLLLLYHIIWLAIPVLVIFTLVGFAMIVLLTTKFLEK
ncbi:MAG: hypothetical protein QMD78_03590, partial [Methanocellales archaeon]|nr:hypothetical protein [Methanocellales archaeon]